MVSQAAEPHARGPSRGVKAHMHGDVDWPRLDRVCHYRVEVTTAEVRGAAPADASRSPSSATGASPRPYPRIPPRRGPRFQRGATLPFRVVNHSEIGKPPDPGSHPRDVCGGTPPTLESIRAQQQKWSTTCSAVTSGSARATAAAPTDRCSSLGGGAENVEPSPRARQTTPDGSAGDRRRRVRAARGQDQGRACDDTARVRARGRGRVLRQAYRETSDEDETTPGRRSDATDLCVAFGVADGVFMWRNQGIDAGLFSRRLMGVASEVFTDEEEDAGDSMGSALGSRSTGGASPGGV